MMLNRPQLLAQHTISRAAWIAVEKGRTVAACMPEAFATEQADFLKRADAWSDPYEERDAAIQDARAICAACGLPITP